MLRGAHLRVTRPRVAVLHALHDSPHADTGTVIEKVRGRHTQVSHQAVYDCLAALTDAGLVRRIQPMGSVARYELRRGDNHHHAVCRSCGSIVDVACATGEAPCLHASGADNFAVDEAEVIYWGLCADCQREKASATAELTTSQPTNTATIKE
ncbi:Fur family transcriptional regulator [Knoellia subterranea KCTC 19937]|uniref:Fur family transcriptional regulator n=1 Tax=Knoellia subterranea KCTC 19937 TaxID=1385521 RepID=A0A0A0JKB4_9MICO|nr:Fur family transcriptional regulator [Knoellia subterranea KCTC 19937]